MKEAIKLVVSQSGQKLFPTDREIRKAGYGAILQRFWKTKGLREEIAASLGLELRAVTKTHLKTQKKTQRWTLAHAKKVILELARQHGGTMPTQAWFNENGFGGLNAWICKKHGGVTNFTKILANEGADIKLRRSKRRRKKTRQQEAESKAKQPKKEVKTPVFNEMIAPKKEYSFAAQYSVSLDRETKIEAIDDEFAHPYVPVPTALLQHGLPR